MNDTLILRRPKYRDDLAKTKTHCILKKIPDPRKYSKVNKPEIKWAVYLSPKLIDGQNTFFRLPFHSMFITNYMSERCKNEDIIVKIWIKEVDGERDEEKSQKENLKTFWSLSSTIMQFILVLCAV